MCFEELKGAMMTIPVLWLPDFTKSFVIETDAPGAAIGAVLTQENHPILYISQGFSTKGKVKSVY